MELTITQNGSLYFAHHKVPKVPKRRAALFCPFRTAANKQGPDIRAAIPSVENAKRAAALKYAQFAA